MNVHDYIKFAAVSALIALTVVTVRRDHKHKPVVVMKVSEIIVTRVAAEEVVEPPNDQCPFEYRSQLRLADCPHRKADDVTERRHPRKSPSDDTRPVKVEHTLSPWTLPWSCGKVKWAANTFSKATLEMMRVANGVAPLTAAQKQQAKECIEGKRS